MGNHRADKGAANRSAAPAQNKPHATTQPGKRRAAKPASPLSKLPLVPSVVGATALGLAGAGAAIDRGVDLASSATQAASPALTSNSISTAVDDRTQAISRDHERTSAAKVAAAQLQQTVDTKAAQRIGTLTKIGNQASARNKEILKNLWHLPAKGYHLTARFGMSSGLWAHNHTGLDFAGPYGTTIYAVANGTIVSTEYDGAYGNKTVERLDDGTEIWYCHQSAFKVNVGDRVTGGESIGSLGATGNTTGPHVHIEVRPGGGDPVDPYAAFVAHGVNP